MKNRFYIVAALIVSAFFLAGAGDAGKPNKLSDIQMLAICWKESSNGADKRDGDNGKAIGPFQIWECYWIDATQHDPSIGGEYSDCRNREYSEKIVQAYMRRYAPKNATFREMCMIHNGGPNILKKSKTSKAYTDASQYAGIVARNLKSLQDGKTPQNK